MAPKKKGGKGKKKGKKGPGYEDVNDAVEKIGHVNLTYFDPPYNQHPYGSNYFMLNIIP